MLPFAENALVDPAKVRDYLLSTSHPVGRFKATVFIALGYVPEHWQVLQADLVALASSGEWTAVQGSPYGEKFEVSGTLRGPSGREASICLAAAYGRERPKVYYSVSRISHASSS